MTEFLHNPANIYLIAFVLFWVLIYMFARKPFFQWLDGEIGKISTELHTARELRAEAEAALADCRAKQHKAENEAKVILQMAKKQAESLRLKAEEELTSALEHQQRMATERIHQAEQKAIEAVRSAAIEQGMLLARKRIQERLSQTEKDALVGQAIESVVAFKGDKKSA